MRWDEFLFHPIIIMDAQETCIAWVILESFKKTQQWNLVTICAACVRYLEQTAAAAEKLVSISRYFPDFKLRENMSPVFQKLNSLLNLKSLLLTNTSSFSGFHLKIAPILIVFLENWILVHNRKVGKHCDWSQGICLSCKSSKSSKNAWHANYKDLKGET